MARFDIAYNITAKHEGGYSNIKADKGGETYRGITKKNFPKFSGWQYLDKQASKTQNQIFPALEPNVKGFYVLNFWQAIRGNEIKNQSIANSIFDFSVNAGSGKVNDFVKYVLNKFGGNFELNQQPASPAQIDFLNNIKADKFLNVFNQLRRDYYKFTAGANTSFDTLFKRYNKASQQQRTSNKQFLAAWINRVDKKSAANTGNIAALGFALVASAYLYNNAGNGR